MIRPPFAGIKMNKKSIEFYISAGLKGYGGQCLLAKRWCFMIGSYIRYSIKIK